MIQEDLEALNRSHFPIIRRYFPSVQAYYKYASSARSRRHIRPATTAGYAISNADLKDLQGDVLKTRIIKDFKDKIDQAVKRGIAIDELSEIVRDFKQSPEFSILVKGQGLATRFFSLKTSSLLAIDKIIADAEDALSNSSGLKLKSRSGA